ncbi:hypothetical protein GW17_00036205 [Ensete ventricosum]|nr:hypothetical protein GW17_00036205 [Ensete ventricosum]
MHRVDAVENSLGVCRELTEGIGSSPGRHKGVRQKKTETRQKIIGDNGPRSSLGIGPSLDDEVGSRREFAKRFAEGIGKLVGNMKGDRQEEDWRTCCKNARGYWIMREIRATANNFRRVNCPGGRKTTHAIEFGWRPVADGG